MYDFSKTKCDTCGAGENDPKIKGLAAREGRMAASFRLGHKGEYWCPFCHKEKELKALFDLMDARDKRVKWLKLLAAKAKRESKILDSYCQVKGLTYADCI